MADPDRSISNGSCFYAPNKEASPNFIPCGNWIFGHVHCCQAGDMCLDDRACFNSRHGTTYLAGCSRFDYQHPSCPDKKPFEDYPWAGLIYCKPNRWVACEQTSRPTIIAKGDPCTCAPESESMTVAFSAPPVITPIASLPNGVGGTIEWQAGHLPTDDPSSISTPAATDSMADSSSSATTSSPTLPVSTLASTPISQPHILTDGAKAGIGIGAAVGAILLFGALSAFWVVLRRRKHDKENEENGKNNVPPNSGAPATTEHHHNTPTSTAGLGFGIAEMPTPEVPPRPAFSELPVGMWGVKSELQGDGTPSTPGSGWGAPLAAVVEQKGVACQQQQHSGDGLRQHPVVVLELPA